MELGKYSMGIGDRFSHQGKAQLAAIFLADRHGVDITPVWNKSHREHRIIGTQPARVRAEADAAVQKLLWNKSYFVDADHINLSNVDMFLESSDFFTLDVADFIGKTPDPKELDAFVRSCREYTGQIGIEGIDDPLHAWQEDILRVGEKFLFAIREAGNIYRYIAARKGEGNFITEVSFDESNEPQKPIELLFILRALAREGVPVRTIAPKFTGRFNKGVDYVGDVEQFTREFNDDIAVIRWAVQQFELPSDLKLSIHSGSDKFSLYGPIHEALVRFDAGVHLKTAGTTWLEELIGLASAGTDSLEVAKDIYSQALDHYEELCDPYATVIDIDPARLPTVEQVRAWSGADFVCALCHDPTCEQYNPHFRQMLHLSYKIAAQMGRRFIDALEGHEAVIAEHVTENLFERHIKPVFIGPA
ncbi:MAG: hypothetical protein JW828_07080 [Sedimentisphaerales bacterium]|nr:hypothetical protein [Sedimentisphaerales bacterium]